MKNKSIRILFVFNCILIVTGWALAIYSYPRLPDQIPLWINFMGQPLILAEKSPAFFVYPIVQTLFVFLFMGIAELLSSREKEEWKKKLLKDHVLLSLIFFNLIFIHVLSSLVLLARQIRGGINRTYFFMIFIVILLLIPYYRMRKKLLAKENKTLKEDP